MRLTQLAFRDKLHIDGKWRHHNPSEEELAYLFHLFAPRVERLQLPVDAGRGMASALGRGSTATTVGETLLYRKANMIQPYPKVRCPEPCPGLARLLTRLVACQGGSSHTADAHRQSTLGKCT
jgi:hypothetical protein